MALLKGVGKADIADLLGLSGMQKGILFHYLKDPHSDQYFEQLSLNLVGEIKPIQIKEAWEEVLATNEMLRTIFRWKKIEQPVQIVLKKMKLAFQEYDFSGGDLTERERLLAQVKVADRQEHFDLESGPLFRVMLCRLADDEAELILSYHHIILDGWSTGVILKEFFRGYTDLVQGQHSRVVQVKKNSFKEYLKWCQIQDQDGAATYWQEYLADFETKTSLPVDQKKEQEIHEVAEVLCTLEQNWANSLAQFAHDRKVTVGSLLYTAWGILLQRYNNTTDSLFGTTVSGRPSEVAGIEEMVGLLINTLPLRVISTDEMLVSDLVVEVHQKMQERLEYQTTPLTEIKGYSQLPMQEELFDSLVVIENYPLDRKLNSANSLLQIQSYSAFEMTNYDLTLSIMPLEEIEIKFGYNPAVYEEGTIRRIAGHYLNLIQQMVLQPEARVVELEMISAQEREELVYGLNQTWVGLSEVQTLQQAFEAQVAETPDQIALLVDGQGMSYAELNRRGNQLARVLREKGVQPDQLVGLMVERSVEMMVGILGILKAGGGYLPIGPEFPQERLDYIIKDSQIQILLTQEKWSDFEFSGETIDLDSSELYTGDGTNLKLVNQGTDLAYVIYTSGSTGKPKGVMVEHQSVINRLTWGQKQYPLGQGDVVLQKTPFTFDVSVWELFWWYFAGATVAFLEPGGEKEAEKILAAIEREQVTVIHFVPSMLNVFLEYLKVRGGLEQMASLKRVFTSGEALQSKHVQLFNTLVHQAHGVSLHNLYGPTETTIEVTYYDCPPGVELQTVPIGKPIANTQIYILDRYQHLQPIGVAGELCVAGVNLARGYLNQPELTAEKFAPHPFEEEARIYRTGDLARWLPDGNIEFLGRIDDQVKIRGYRIELQEIEHTILGYSGIREVAVLAQTEQVAQGESYLSAYYTSTDGQVNEAELREYLADILPGYMIPTYFVQVEMMPLTASGKINRKALSKVGLTSISVAEYVAPANEIEQKLVAIWSEILAGLSIEQIGVCDNFFALGGHSLKATILVSKVYKEFGVELTLQQLFETPTIQALAEVIQSGAGESDYEIQPVEEQEYYPISSAQRRLFILDQMADAEMVYNMPGAFVIEGELEVDALRGALNRLVARHESLRTSFALVNGEPVQKIHSQVEVDLKVEIRDQQTDEEWIREFVQPFDLSQAPLFRVKLIQLLHEGYMLLFDMHHIISDGVSIQLLKQDLMALYDGKELPPFRVQYKDYVQWQHEFMGSERMRRQEEYWLQEFDQTYGQLPVLEMPTDYQRPARMSYVGEQLEFVIDAPLAQEIQDLAKAHGATLFMVLLAAYNLLLSRYTGQEDLIIGSPIAGRRSTDAEKIIGMFVNTLALRNYPRGVKTFSEFLHEVRERTLQAFEYQDYPFESLVEKLDLHRDLSRHPLFDVMLVVQNMEDQPIRLKDLNFIPYAIETKQSKFDLTLLVTEKGEQLHCTLEYSSSLFKPETMARLAEHFQMILKSVVQEPEVMLAQVEMLTEEEGIQLMVEYNETDREYRKDQTIQQIFAEQVAKNPNQLAVVSQSADQLQELTYADLDARSNQLARELRHFGVKPDSVVGLVTERRVATLVSILAIIKAGGAYLPIDPDYPPKRVEYLLEDGECQVLLAGEEVLASFGEIHFSGTVVNIDDPAYYQGDDRDLELVNQPDDLLYIIYTSGTTGHPKGIMMEHQGVVNLLAGLKEEVYQYYPGHLKVALLAPFIFDASVQQIFAALLQGHTLFIVPDQVRTNGNELIRYYQQQQIEISDGTPAHVHLMVNAVGVEKEIPSLKHLIIGGEALPTKVVDEFFQEFTGGEFKMTNIYGPAECCVDSTAYLIDPDELPQKPVVPIGKPLANKQIYILDQSLQLVPKGVIGDIYIAGVGLARGYFNRVELTAERFVPNPFGPETKMYYTGDQGRWLADGNIEFTGRVDHQVKIRGYRIELGEIENHLLKHPEVQEAVVVADQDQGGDTYLCAYYTLRTEEEMARQLKEYLTEVLPHYMIPAHFVQLEEMPLTPNGKIDRKGLPKVDRDLRQSAYIAPRDELEMRLTEIWADVLGVEQVGIEDDFFDLGGHSLKATAVVAQVYRQLNLEIPLSQIFTSPTIAAQAEYLRGQSSKDFLKIPKVEEREDGLYKGSSAQKRLYVINELEGDTTAYNMPGVLTVTGRLDLDRLTAAFQQLIQRHESLRTSFTVVNGQPMQKIHPEVPFEIEELKLGQATTEQMIQQQIQQWIRPFDLSQAPLLRVALLTTADQQLLIFDMHHIISDGRSMEILIAEMTALYAGQELPEVELQYKDVAVWQAELFASPKMQEQEKYWLELFADESLPVLNLPTDRPRPAVKTFAGDRVRFAIDYELATELKALSKDSATTLYMVLLAAYNLFLAKYTGQEDIIIGSPISGRTAPGMERVLGMFVNTLALRNQPVGDLSFKEFLAQVKENALNAFVHQDYPMEMLVEKLHLQRDLSRQPLFDVAFALESMEQTTIQLADLTITPVVFTNPIAKFDLTLTAVETGGGLEFVIEYSTDLFVQETIRRMAGHFKNILTAVVQKATIPMATLQMTSPVERESLLNEFNPTRRKGLVEKTLTRIFEEQVAGNPEQIALIFNGQKLSYGELNRRVNQLARKLRQKGVQPDQIVAIMAQRSLEMLIGIWAILKAGGAYLPLNPHDPVERIQYLLTDTEAQIMLTHTQDGVQVEFSGEMIDLADANLYQGDDSNLEQVNQPEDLAYVIYTSGTTGMPKGNLTTHRNINRVVKETNYIELTAEDRLLQLSNYAFDGSTFDIYGALLNGATLVLVEQDTVLELDQLARLIKEEGITVFFVTTALFNTLVDTQIQALTTVRKILFGGERVSVAHARKALAKLGPDRLIHVYGPTESTVYATYYPINQIPAKVDTIPIGKPLADTEVYILNQYRHLLPVGVVGELCISGTGLARGYLNRPELTAEKFVSHPFRPGERIYRTGDLARWLPDGNIEFVGRIDQQVKVRGFRIELGEIETQLLTYPGIKEGLVIDREAPSGEKYLCAYLVAEAGGQAELSITQIKDFLSSTLPEYMIPAYFMVLDRLPMTTNGKVDRRALPEPAAGPLLDVEYVAPTNPVEEKLAAIWMEVLGVERVGINDSFFDLGGHSLKATILSARIQQECQVQVPLREIFKAPTVKGLATYLEGQEKMTYTRIKKATPREFYPASSAQTRLYLLDQLEGASTVYNMPGVFELKGQVDPERIEVAFQTLVQRHDAFRTSFASIDGNPVQKVHSDVQLLVEEFTCTEEEVPSVVADFVRPFDLSQAPLFRVGLVRITAEKYLLLFDMHHIISDGTSVNIMIQDFIALYAGDKLAELEIQYKDYTIWQKEFLTSEEMAKQETYWLELFNPTQGQLPVLDLPTDFPRPAVMNYAGDTVEFYFDPDLTTALKEMTQEYGVTLYMALLAAYNLLLSRYSGQEDIIVGSPIAGRAHPDLSGIIGMFVNTLAMRNQPVAEKTFTDFLLEVKAQALEAYENQDYQFEMLVEKLGFKRDLSRNPLFDTMFVLQNIDQRELTLEDLVLRPIEIENPISRFDLFLTAEERGNTLGFAIEYSTNLFRRETIERFFTHFTNIVQEVVANPTVQIGQIQMISKQEREELIYGLNQTQVDYPKEKTITQLFTEQVERTPDQIAVSFEGEQLTYRELDQKANALAYLLRQQGVGKDVVVGLMLPRTLEMVIGIIGILKANGICLPLDLRYPKTRIQMILEDSETQVILVQRKDQQIENYSGRMIEMDELPTDESLLPPSIEAESKGGDSLAYLIYTSGSTGKSKGVMLYHQGIINHALTKNRELALTEADRLCHNLSVNFVASIWQVFSPLMIGAELVVYSENVMADSLELFKRVEQDQVTVLEVVPSALISYLDVLDDGMDKIQLADLRMLLLTGEKVAATLVNRFYSLYEIPLVNAYGQSECSDDTLHYQIPYNRETKVVPIGRPANNTQLYVLNQRDQLQPIGLVGELCISGDGLAKGYLKRPELTAEKFVANPFHPGYEQMYRTGDLVRWLPDGNIEYIGRKDHQVKIRGFRIELGEIEKRLYDLGYTQAVVVDREDATGTRYLCAYLVASDEVDVLEVRRELARELPEYMIPAYFVTLDKLPLNPNGKVDRKALPAPASQVTTEYQVPTSPVEIKLATIWSQVLGADKIGITDNFFMIGGHSLKATQLISRINKEFGVELALREIFKSPTIREQAIQLQKLEDGGQRKQSFVIEKVEPRPDHSYPVSSAQKRLFVVNQLGDANLAYNMFSATQIKGNLDPERLEGAFSTLIQRHESLRTSFKMVQGNLMQQIHPHTEVEFVLEEYADLQMVEQFSQVFDLSQAPLIRAGLIRHGEDQILLVDLHHIISDGMSMDLILNEIIAIYAGEELAPLNLQYKDFAVWQNQLFASEAIQKQEEYWLNEFTRAIPVLNLPTDEPRPAYQSTEGSVVHFTLDPELMTQISAMTRRTGTTLYMFLLATFNILLAKYSGQDDIIVGSPVAGRTHPDLEPIVGMFVNMLAMRNTPKASSSFEEFLVAVKEKAVQGFENQDYQFEMLVDQLSLKKDLIQRDVSRNPLFDVVLVLQNTSDLKEQPRSADLVFQEYPFEETISKFDLTLGALETAQGLQCRLNYATRLFKRSTVEGMVTHFENIVRRVLAEPTAKIGAIDLLSPWEKEQILTEFNQTEAAFSKEQTIQQIFEEQARLWPERTAVTWGEEELTYRELNERANQLAWLLREEGVGADTLVGMLVERSFEMIIGIFAILKAGGAYVPIDPKYPKERIHFMLKDSETSILLTQSNLQQQVVADFDGVIIDLGRDERILRQSTTNLPNTTSPSDLAYIIYTSGSTGKPKGMMIEHVNVVRLFKTEPSNFDFDQDDVWTLFHSYCFDFSVWEIFGPLLFGGRLVIVSDEDRLDPERFVALCKRERVTVLNQTPQAFYNLIQAELNATDHTLGEDLRYVIFGGDTLNFSKLIPWAELYSLEQIALINMYGITETTVHVTYERIKEEDLHKGWRSMIGRPIYTNTLYLMDPNGNPVPVGVPGEIYVGGYGPGRGYLNRPELTAEKFVLNSFVPGERLYRSGDLGKFHPDGNVEYLGRIDHQVKIRGFRIELGEIQEALLSSPDVQDAVVLTKLDQQGSSYLIGYLVPKSELLDLQEVKTYLLKRLPDYMVPQRFVILRELPLTSNGKVDRKALPEPELEMERQGVQYVAPRDQVEEKIAQIWTQFLEVEQVGVHDNFFEVGGNSLNLIKVFNELKEHFPEGEVKIADLFEYNTIAMLADLLRVEEEGSDDEMDDDMDLLML